MASSQKPNYIPIWAIRGALDQCKIIPDFRKNKNKTKQKSKTKQVEIFTPLKILALVMTAY